MQRVEKKMEDKGYQVDMTGEPLYFINYTNHKKQKNNNLMTLQLVGHPRDFLDYDEGYAPELPNEVAFSKDIMKENHWQIGDFVTANINGKKQNMIISGTFTDYMQLGKVLDSIHKLTVIKKRCLIIGVSWLMCIVHNHKKNLYKRYKKNFLNTNGKVDKNLPMKQLAVFKQVYKR